MRYVLVASLIAISCSVAFGQEAVSPPDPPHPVVPQACPSPEQAEHLLKAATHLEAAGRHDMAVQVRQQAKRGTSHVASALPLQKAETQPPRFEVGDTRQVLLRLRILELSVDKLHRLGLNFEAASGGKIDRSGIPSFGSFGTVNKNQADSFLEALTKDKLARTLAEPNLVTLNGHHASFRAGEEVPVPTKHSDGTVSIEFKHAMEFDYCPTILSDGSMRIELRAEVNELDEGRTAQVKGIAIPGVSSAEIRTQTAIPSGQTVVIRGLIQNRTPASRAAEQGDASQTGKQPAAELPDRTELLVLITPEIIAPVSASTASAK